MQPLISVLPRSEDQGETVVQMRQFNKIFLQCNGARTSPQTFQADKQCLQGELVSVSSIHFTDLHQALKVRATSFLKVTTMTLGLDIAKQAYKGAKSSIEPS